MRSFLSTGLVVSTMLSVALPIAPAALAQTAGQLVAPTYAPPVERAPGGALTFPASTGLEAPEGADQLFVTPSGLDVEGGLPALAGETAEIAAAFEGKRVSAADLFTAATRLEAAYVRAGYPLIRVSLPPQTIEDGDALKLVVTEGFVESADTAALPANVAERVDAVMAPLVDAKNPTSREIERRLLLAGDTPGLDMKSTLSAGSLPGATTLSLSGRYDPVTGYIGVDNSLSEELGGYSVYAGVNFNDLLGLGEVGYLRLGGWPGFGDGNVFEENPKNRQVAAGFTLPIGVDGWALNIEGVDSRTQSDTDLAYVMPDHYQRFSANLSYGWLRSRSANATTILRFDAIREKQRFIYDSLSTPFTLDQLRVFRITQEADFYLPSNGRLTADATLSFGIDGLGAREPTAALPMSRDGAEPDFQKLFASAFYLQPLDRNFGVSLAAQAQTSFGAPLASSEQLGLGGLSWLSAFTTSEIEADTGATVRTELSWTTDALSTTRLGAFAATASPYVFVAAGIGKLEQPTVFEDAVTRAGSFGLGVRLAGAQAASPYSGALTLEYAHGVTNSGDHANRFNVSFLTRF